MARAVWKGAIAFGLVHVPVALYPASQESEVDFDWLDKRSLDPVGYKRINKRTGKEVTKDHIVKGVAQDDGSYVVLSDDEVREAYPRTTQTIEIEDFVPATEISFAYLEKPYYLEPTGRADKVYALLREAMASASLIGIARMVMHNKEHLVALLPAGPALMLGTLRWSAEIRAADQLSLPPAGKAQLKDSELQMARQLIAKMKTSWRPDKYADRFTGAIRKLVEAKVKAGEAKTVEPLEEAPSVGESNVVDLTELLRSSLGPQRKAPRKAPRKAAAQKASRASAAPAAKKKARA
ncbi:MAG TPA: Ku protein [Burkholderiaceae bacterium]|nr:Ku protein [Burkholderiaceae bacterium]